MIVSKEIFFGVLEKIFVCFINISKRQLMTLLYDFPLGTSPDTAVSNLIGLRCTAPAAVNVNATMWVERC